MHESSSAVLYHFQLIVYHLLDPFGSWISSRLHVSVYTSYSESDARCTVLLQSKRLREQPAEFLGCAGGSTSCTLAPTVPAAQGTSEITTKRQVSCLTAQ